MKQFICQWNEMGHLTEIRHPNDPYETNFLLSLGRLELPDHGVIAEHTWEETEDALLWHVTLTNRADQAVVLDNICFYIQANTAYEKDQETTYHHRVMQHAVVCGHSSFFYWCRPSGEGPYLALLAIGNTSLTESLNAGTYAVRAAADTLEAGKQKQYTFALVWIDDHDAIQKAIYEHGGLALDVFPGLTVPGNLELLLKPRCKQGVRAVTCRNAQITARVDGVYAIRFEGVGERNVDISYGGGCVTTVKCFATRPIEELISMRARHIVKYQRYVGDQWYDGMFSQWSAVHRRMTTPDDTMDLMLYMVSADDPGLCKAPYLAEKNVFRPNAEEIAAIEYYIERFVWGGLQRTDQEEPYPYGIYGSDTWKKNRESGTGYACGGIGQERMWRTFDYTHLIQLYFNMYLIAKNYPDKVHYLDANGYLERARRTALAYFEVPYSIYMRDYWAHWGYSDWAFKQGNFHERYILPLLEACQDERLRYNWETKCKLMICDTPLPYGSEMIFDSTAFESTQAVAHYVMEHGLKPDVNGWYDKNLNGPGKGGYRSHPVIDPAKHERFLHRQMAANVACRGSQMRSFFMQGSDFRTGGYKTYLLSYMSQMGGAAVLDYALYFDKEPWKLLRTGYASLLAPWCLVNLGEDDPYYPHADNEGAVGWAWQPEEMGMCWDFMRCKRGPWPYDGEIDNGLSGAICASCSILAQDPDFGLVCYGGTCEEKDGSIFIEPRDGVRRQFHDVRDTEKRLHLSVSRDAIKQIVISCKADARMTLVMENVTGDQHVLELTINGKTCQAQVLAEREYHIDIAQEEVVSCG